MQLFGERFGEAIGEGLGHDRVVIVVLLEERVRWLIGAQAGGDRESADVIVAAGIERSRIIVDPGIGFGKSFRHNLDVLQQFTRFHGLGVPVLMGLSRKGFIGALTGEKLAGNRVNGSVGGALWAVFNGAQILRVHDVKEMADVARITDAIITAS